jgi:hypothetical protein
MTMNKMIRAIFVILMVFFATNVNAQEELIPGSYTIQYGGLYKIAADESSRFISNEWRDQERLWYKSGAIEFGDFLRRQRRMAAHLNNWRDGPPWWTRSWWHSFEEKDGGAPPNKSIIVKRGSTYRLVNTPLFSISNSFKFSWKSFQGAVDYKAKSSIIFGIGNVRTPTHGWKFRFSPEFKFSTSKIFDGPSKIIRRLGARFTAIYLIKKPIVSIEVRAWYNPIRRRSFVSVQLTLLQW